MTNTQCKSCLLDGDAREALDFGLATDLRVEDISTTLAYDYGEHISPSAIRRHKQNHYVSEYVQPETLLGVVDSPSVVTNRILSNAYISAAKIPASQIEFEPGKVYTSKGEVPVDEAKIFAEHGVNPDDYEIARISRWEVVVDGDTQWNTSYQFKPKFKTLEMPSEEEEVDLPALYAAARLATPTPKPAPSMRATIAVYADPQLGKTGRRGGTKETIERSMVVRGKLASLLESRKPEHAVLMDAGDGIEGFNSGGNPMFTNDLSLPGQLDIYSTELFEFVNVLHRYAPTTVMGVPSNHAAWRNGKQQLGNPQDDFGLFVHKQVEKVTKAAGMSVDYVAPLDYDESVVFRIFDTTLGLVHGHQFNPGKAIDWWQKQTFGAGAVTMADIMVYGHYHTFTAGAAGRNPHNQRQRWCFGAPTLDNGSDWFRQIAGYDSDPGLLVFDVTENGFDLSSLVILDCE